MVRKSTFSKETSAQQASRARADARKVADRRARETAKEVTIANLNARAAARKATRLEPLMPTNGLDENDNAVRFYVEADNTIEADPPLIVHCFAHHKEAWQEFERLSQRFPYVWLSEYGRYNAGNGFKEDWMYYSWTKAVAWGDPVGRFTGYPNGDDPLSVYDPIDQDGRSAPE